LSTLHEEKLSGFPVQRGGYILWDETARAVMFKTDDHDCAGMRRGTDNKWSAPFIRDERDFLDFSFLIANMFGYGSKKVKDLPFPAFRFI